MKFLGYVASSMAWPIDALNLVAFARGVPKLWGLTLAVLFPRNYQRLWRQNYTSDPKVVDVQKL